MRMRFLGAVAIPLMLLRIYMLPLQAASESAEAVCEADGSCEVPPEKSTNDWDFLQGLSQEDALVRWIQALEGGKVNTDKFRIERIDPQDDSLPPSFDMYATTDIAKGEILMEIPQSARIGSGLFASSQHQKDHIDAILEELEPLDENDDDTVVHLDTCLAIEHIVDERSKGAGSRYHPYLDFVFGSGNPTGRRPSEWSNTTQSIFWTMLGQKNTIYTPEKIYYHILIEEVCKHYTDKQQNKTATQTTSKVERSIQISKLKERAYTYFAKHAWGTELIPLFDLIPHRNGVWKNIEARFVETATQTPVGVTPRLKRFEGFSRDTQEPSPPDTPETTLVVYAHRDIASGEPLRVSYNKCEHLGCDILAMNYTTSEFIADAGFVEEYPRRWYFMTDILEAREIDSLWVFDIDIDPSTQEKTFQLVQANDPKNFLYAQAFLRTSVDRWEGLRWELEELTKDLKNSTVKDKMEYEMLWGYYEGYTEAFQLAWAHRHDQLHTDPISGTNSTYQTTMEGYDDLAKPYGPALHTKGDYWPCAEGELVDLDQEPFGSIQTFYQHVQYFYEDGINTWMKMATTLHSASSFRAHYHESVVQVALQYVKEPKRVAYIGGGDNMVLAELLKYPSIELVVGMELDQQVCRSSFKYFGTTPAYHDKRVEWWFGNGANTLQHIPSGYFGSFDWVLVDLLTDVAEGIKVTADLSLADVAPLLLNPNTGVLARNEDYADKSQVTTRMAQRVVMYDYWDFPRLCRGSMSIASNSVDFARGPRYDHKTPTLVRLLDFENDQFDGWSRYYDSTTIDPNSSSESTTKGFDARVCQKIQKALPEHSARSFTGGMLLVIEAEDVTVSMESSDIPTLHEKIAAVANRNGLEILQRVHEMNSDEHSFLLLLKDGYIKMLTYPEYQYVAFDLMLWGDVSVLDKSNAIQDDLVAVVGGGVHEGSVSSFRVSTGGLDLSQTGDSGDDDRKSGTNGLVEKAVEYYCGTDPGNDSSTVANGKTKRTPGSVGNDGTDEGKDGHLVFDNSSILFHEIASGVTALNNSTKNQKIVFAIFCGKKEEENCRSYSAASSATTANGTTIFHPVYSCESFDDMTGCESEITQKLQGMVTDEKRLNGFVLDRSVPLEMGKILHKVFNNTLYQSNFLEHSFVALAPIPGGDSSWKSILLDRFRTELVIAPPANKADVRLSNGAYSEIWSILSIQNDNFFRDIQETSKSIEEKTGWNFTTIRILDSIVPLKTDFDPIRPKDKDFYREDVRAQWFDQKPVARQYLLQMELGSSQAPLELHEKVLVGENFFLDGVFSDSKGFLLDYFEGTIVDVIGPNNYVVETQPYVNKAGETLTFKQSYDHGNKITKSVPRRQIRKIASTERDRKYDVGDLVLVQHRDSETGEVIPVAWNAAIISAINDEGIYVRHKESKRDHEQIEHALSREDILLYFESPEFRISNEGVSLEQLDKAFEYAVVAAGFADEGKATIQDFRVGKEYLYVWNFLSPTGSGILVWDGKNRVEMNMFVKETNDDEDDDPDFEIDSFLKEFQQGVSSLTIVAKDAFPRGFGKVVNFQYELFEYDTGSDGELVEFDYIPHWIPDRNKIIDEINEGTDESE